jgi:DNA-binding SARP family transcriptional activator
VLYRLRRALGGSGSITLEDEHYAVSCTLEYTFDVETFSASLAEAQRLRARAPAQAIYYLSESIACYRGDFLEDLPESDWLLLRREELHRKYLEALLAKGQLCLTAGQYEHAANALRQAIAHDGYLEQAHRQLMECYAQQGEAGRALRHYQTLAEWLDRETHLSPAPETTALFERLSRSEPP